ncbi:MAG: sigma-54 dependent transcriptional regulator [Pseudomonadota bacterium]
MKILIIGQRTEQIQHAAMIAQDNGANIIYVDNIKTAIIKMCEGNNIEIIIIDVKLDVESLINNLLSQHINVPVIGCGLNDSAADAVKAIKAGAKEYLPLPPDAELIASIINLIANQSTNECICQSAKMKKILDMADKIANSDANILITGESGTGKEIIARYIHNNSNRQENRFVTINCAAIPENLMESELFGHEKGSFTGALTKRIGKFEESNNGTLLLDEISEMSVTLQAKLLRAIQEKEIDRVGGKTPIKINLRILATSNRKLSEEVAAGNFRKDLMFRLNIIHLEIPPLRARQEDIIPLANFFIKKYSDLNDTNITSMDKEVEKLLLSYQWPGNVRELENTMHRAVLLNQTDKIIPSSIIFSETNDSDEADHLTNNSDNKDNINNMVGRTIGSVEKDLIMNTINHCQGNRTHAANILGISIRTLRNKLKQYEDNNF